MGLVCGAQCPAAYGSNGGAGSLPTAASEDTHVAPGSGLLPNGGGADGSGGGGAVPNPYSMGAQPSGCWPPGAQPPNLHHSQAMNPGINATLNPSSFDGPPPFFPQYGMPPPGYGMPGAMPSAIWPGMAGGRGLGAGGNQSGSKADKDNLYVAYYSAYGPQQMAAAATAGGGPSARDMHVAAQQQQQQLALMYQQNLLLQQYSLVQAAAAAGRVPAPAGGVYGGWRPPVGPPAQAGGVPGAWPGGAGVACGGVPSQGGSLPPPGPFSLFPSAAGAGPAATAPVNRGRHASSQPARMNSAPDRLAGAAAHLGANGATSVQEPACGGSMGMPGGTDGGTGGCEPGVGNGGEMSAPGEPSRRERRAQALHKYKQKRKNLCFTKKIRYDSRKQLAQARPRVKGQFVRVGADASGGTALAASVGDATAEASGGTTAGGSMGGPPLAPPSGPAALGNGAPVYSREMGVVNLMANPSPYGQEAGLGDARARAPAVEEDDEDNVVNSPQELMARVRLFCPAHQMPLPLYVMCRVLTELCLLFGWLCVGCILPTCAE